MGAYSETVNILLTIRLFTSSFNIIHWWFLLESVVMKDVWYLFFNFIVASTFVRWHPIIRDIFSFLLHFCFIQLVKIYFCRTFCCLNLANRRALSSWLLCPLNTFSFSVSSSLLSHKILASAISLSIPGSFSVKWYIETKIWLVGVPTVIGLSLLPGPFRGQN